MLKPLCIYHGGCDDGFGAAFVLLLGFGQDGIDLYPGVYQKDPPDVTGRDVVMVDFSYKRPVIEAMAAKARSILILDHHKTAEEDLAGFPKPHGLGWNEHLAQVAVDDAQAHIHGKSGIVYALFDMQRSGAGLTWDYFNGTDISRPDFINYLEDRDLWRKALPNCDEFTICLRSYPQTYDAWLGLWSRGVPSLIEEGTAIQRYYRARVEDLKRHAYRATIAGYPVRIVNAPYFAASEVAGELADDNVAFGACFFQVAADRWQYSLRSRSGTFDVSEVAKTFGGGGHKSAAGFTVAAPVHEKTP